VVRQLLWQFSTMSLPLPANKIVNEQQGIILLRISLHTVISSMPHSLSTVSDLSFVCCSHFHHHNYKSVQKGSDNCTLLRLDH
jgi:hypothetical protein